MRGPSRQMTSALVAGAFRPRGDRARKVGDDQALGAVGDIGQRQRLAGREQFGGRLRHRSAAPALRWKSPHPAEHRRVVFGRYRRHAGHPASRSRLRRIEQLLEFVELGIAERADMGIGKSAHDQIGLADAAMPGPEQQPPPAGIEAFARTCASGHASANAKSPAGPGADLYRRIKAACQRGQRAIDPAALTAMTRRTGRQTRIARHSAARSMPHAPVAARSAVCFAHDAAGRRPEGREALRPPARAR